MVPRRVCRVVRVPLLRRRGGRVGDPTVVALASGGPGNGVPRGWTGEGRPRPGHRSRSVPRRWAGTAQHTPTAVVGPSRRRQTPDCRKGSRPGTRLGRTLHDGGPPCGIAGTRRLHRPPILRYQYQQSQPRIRTGHARRGARFPPLPIHARLRRPSFPRLCLRATHHAWTWIP